MTPLPDVDSAVLDVHRLEQTASTAPSELSKAQEKAASSTSPSVSSDRASGELEATIVPSGSEYALAFARHLVLAVALSGLSVSPQAVMPPMWRRRNLVTSSESSAVAVNPALVQYMRHLFERGASEFFEDGMDSVFVQELLRTVDEYGNAAIDAIAEYLFSSKANSDVGSEALRRLGDIKDRRILASRWALLQRSLKHQSSRIRDGAILGFAALDDPYALALLKAVVAEEPVPELRQLIEKVIRQLSETNGEIAAQS